MKKDASRQRKTAESNAVDKDSVKYVNPKLGIEAYMLSSVKRRITLPDSWYIA
jgi:hypothetical protein